MSIIRNQEALEQPLDFSSLSRFSNGVTDLDACVNLKNGYLIDIEVKKDTFSHTFENIRFSRQWRILETKSLVVNCAHSCNPSIDASGVKNGAIVIYAILSPAELIND